MVGSVSYYDEMIPISEKDSLEHSLTSEDLDLKVMLTELSEENLDKSKKEKKKTKNKMTGSDLIKLNIDPSE
jgi:hypothetical protein